MVVPNPKPSNYHQHDEREQRKFELAPTWKLVFLETRRLIALIEQREREQAAEQENQKGGGR